MPRSGQRPPELRHFLPLPALRPDSGLTRAGSGGVGRGLVALVSATVCALSSKQASQQASKQASTKSTPKQQASAPSPPHTPTLAACIAGWGCTVLAGGTEQQISLSAAMFRRPRCIAAETAPSLHGECSGSKACLWCAVPHRAMRTMALSRALTLERHGVRTDMAPNRSAPEPIDTSGLSLAGYR
ncbi:hypothetical protein FN846DRAFT_981562 [Sphaerosporella brunnea]|uniref:Uncharacterized protein n=1 Tax=Sphaerosporella brunnea TaxID=1250544 RepID=A0A5J5EDQ3_9PEZI|nr:hypothetical protein FN846DRAFT_981562 [Sphaerosporella brunnea]